VRNPVIDGATFTVSAAAALVRRPQPFETTTSWLPASAAADVEGRRHPQKCQESPKSEGT